MIARALTRKGTALVKMAKCSKDYDIAIETFQKALTEHRNPDTLKKLNDAERIKKELEQQEYFDPKLADEEREKGTSRCLNLAAFITYHHVFYIKSFVNCKWSLQFSLPILHSPLTSRTKKIISPVHKHARSSFAHTFFAFSLYSINFIRACI